MNKIRHIVFLILSVWSSFVYTQIESNTGDKNLIEQYLEKSSENIKKAPNLSLDFAEKAEKLSQQSQDYHNLAKAYYLKGVALKAMDQYDTSLVVLQKARFILIAFDDKIENGKTNRVIGEIFTAQKNFETAQEYFTKAEELFLSENYEIGLASVYSSIGVSLKEQAKLEKSLEYHKKALEIQLKHNKDEDVSSSYNNIGIVYRRQGKLELAEENYKKAIEIDTKLGLESQLSGRLINLGAVYRLEKKYDKAIEILQKGYKLAEKNEKRVWQRNAAGQLYLVYKDLKNDHLALKYLDIHRDINEDIFDLDKTAQINELHLKLKSVNAQIELNKLGQKNQQNLQKLELQTKISRILIISSIMGSLLLALSFYFFLRTRKAYRKVNKINGELKVKSDLIEYQNSQLKELNYEKNEIIRIVAHDLKAPLNQIHWLAELTEISGKLNSEQKDFIDKMMFVSDKASKMVRKILDIDKIENETVNLTNTNLNKLINSVLYQYSDEAEKKNIQLIFQESPETIVKSDMEKLERVLENLVTNAIKFSPFNKPVRLKIETFPTFHQLIMEDQGPGFRDEDFKNLFKKFTKLSARPTNNESSSGLGLSIVKQICDKLNIKITVDKSYKKGARFILEFTK